MDRRYNLRLKQLTESTMANTLAICKRVIVNEDYVKIVVSSKHVIPTLREVYEELQKEYDDKVIHARIVLKVPFTMREIKKEVLATFNLK